jgi:hypothetical protein
MNANEAGHGITSRESKTRRRFEALRALWEDFRIKIRTVRFWIEILAVAAAIFYALITYRMWQDTHRNFEIDERAWIKVASNIPAQQVIKEGTPIEGNVILENTGKSFAKQLYVDFCIVVVKNNQAPDFVYTIPHAQNRIQILQPNDATTFLVRASETPTSEPEVLTKSQVDDLLNGRAYLAIYGEGQYKDIFGELHWFRNCGWQTYYSQGNYTAFKCTTYNDTGDGPLPPQ